MRLLEISYPDPPSNLALDEALLDEAESGEAAETLRIWESPSRFIVLGVSQRVDVEVYRDACERDEVPVLRRCTAGGCVLQGPGCLNFSLVLHQEMRPEISTVRASYTYIFDRLLNSFGQRGVRLEHKGISDLARNGRKVSGNAQRRRKRFILHHGTLMYQGNLELMSQYLREPLERPEYRGTRTHREFMSTIPLSVPELLEAVTDAFPCESHELTASRAEQALQARLLQEKYCNPAWNFRR